MEQIKLFSYFKERLKTLFRTAKNQRHTKRDLNLYIKSLLCELEIFQSSSPIYPKKKT